MVAVPSMVCALLCFVFCIYLKSMLNKKKVGKDIDVPVLDKLSAQVKSGAMAFLKEEYKFLSIFVVVLAFVLFLLYLINPVAGKTKDYWDDGFRIAFAFVA